MQPTNSTTTHDSLCESCTTGQTMGKQDLQLLLVSRGNTGVRGHSSTLCQLVYVEHVQIVYVEHVWETTTGFSTP